MRSDPTDPSVGARIDRCPDCSGLFLEFFDGEPSAISRGLGRRRELEGSAPPAQSLRCPDCDEAMVRRAYLQHGPELARCETCLAVFLTPAEAEELARLTLPPEELAESSWLERLLRWIPGVS